MIIEVESVYKKQVLDITPLVERHIEKNKWADGIMHLYVAHTTCSLATTDLDPGTDSDILYAIDHMLPKGTYRHPHDPDHVGDHILSSLIGQSAMVPIHNGKLLLGMWQRIVLIELNGPRPRSLMVRLIRTVDS